VKKEKSISKLTKELDTIFSKFIRLSHAKNGLCACYTCGHESPIKKIHAGHYITRYYKATRWDERNVRPQCFMCNIYRKGNSVIFRQNLVRELGEDIVKEMESSANILIRGGLDRDMLLGKITHYKKIVDNLPLLNPLT
jgi:hypothetical protein